MAKALTKDGIAVEYTSTTVSPADWQKAESDLRAAVNELIVDTRVDLPEGWQGVRTDRC